KPIQARPVGRWEKAAEWVRRNPVVATLIAAVVLVLVAGTAVSLYFAIDASQQAEQAINNEADAKRNAEKAKRNAETAKKKKAEAVAAKDDLEKANKRLEYSRDKLEDTLARLLVRPLGLHLLVRPLDLPAAPLTDQEIEALWELAGNPSEG